MSGSMENCPPLPHCDKNFLLKAPQEGGLSRKYSVDHAFDSAFLTHLIELGIWNFNSPGNQFRLEID